MNAKRITILYAGILILSASIVHQAHAQGGDYQVFTTHCGTFSASVSDGENHSFRGRAVAELFEGTRTILMFDKEEYGTRFGLSGMSVFKVGRRPIIKEGIDAMEEAMKNPLGVVTAGLSRNGANYKSSAGAFVVTSLQPRLVAHFEFQADRTDEPGPPITVSGDMDLQPLARMKLQGSGACLDGTMHVESEHTPPQLIGPRAKARTRALPESQRRK